MIDQLPMAYYVGEVYEVQSEWKFQISEEARKVCRYLFAYGEPHPISRAAKDGRRLIDCTLGESTRTHEKVTFDSIELSDIHCLCLLERAWTQLAPSVTRKKVCPCSRLFISIRQ